MNHEQLRVIAADRHRSADAFARNARLARLAVEAAPRAARRRFAREICLGPLCVRFVVWGV